MPNRILREGILTSERVNALPVEAELFYRRLLSVVDDYGRYSAHPSLLRAACYPLRLEETTDAEISHYLEACAAAGLMQTYRAEGKPFLEVLDFRQRTRAMKSKCPPPDGHQDATGQAGAWHPAGICPPSDRQLTGDGQSDDSHPQAETETETETETISCATKTIAPESADLVLITEAEDRVTDAWLDRQHDNAFWPVYWRHVAKSASRRAFRKRVRLLVRSQKLSPTEAVEFLCEQARQDRERFESTADWEWRRNLHPSTWLNGERWGDEVSTGIAAALPKTKAERYMEAMLEGE